MEINFKDNKLKIPFVRKVSEFGKICGLMFSRREKARALLFEFKRPVKMRIHSFFVFFPFLAIWFDEKNKVIYKKIVKPWKVSVSPREKYSKLLEIPLNNFYKEFTDEVRKI